MTDQQFQQECIQAHNQKRALHGAPPLQLADDLATSAQAWADHVAQSGNFCHSHDRGDVGENIAMKWESDPSFVFSGSDVTTEWYSEIENYSYGTEDMNCGHFSQVVWKSSTAAGFGRAKAADGKVYVVGQYRPAGNVMGQWQENVSAPQKENGEPKADKSAAPAATPTPTPAAAPAPAPAAQPVTPTTPESAEVPGTTQENGHAHKKKKKGKLLSCFKKTA